MEAIILAIIGACVILGLGSIVGVVLAIRGARRQHERMFNTVAKTINRMHDEPIWKSSSRVEPWPANARASTKIHRTTTRTSSRSSSRSEPSRRYEDSNDSSVNDLLGIGLGAALGGLGALDEPDDNPFDKGSGGLGGFSGGDPTSFGGGDFGGGGSDDSW